MNARTHSWRTVRRFALYIRTQTLIASLAALTTAASHSAASAAHEAVFLCRAAAREIDNAAAATIAQGSPGMIVEVAQAGRTLFSRSYGLADLESGARMERDSVFQIASVTKMFTAAAILSLVEEGRLSLDDQARKYLPEATVAGDVKIYELLVQTSGIPDFTEDPALSETKSVKRSIDQMIDLISGRSSTLNFKPGRRWEYSNSNYVLLGAIAQRITGQDLQTIFDERLFGPARVTTIRFDDPSDVVPKRVRGYREDTTRKLGFSNADWISPTVPGAAGGLRGAAPDLIRWSEALFGGEVLEEDSVRAMSSAGLLEDGRTTKFGMPDAWREGLNSDYGMGLFIKLTPGGTRFAHSGQIDGFSSWFAHYPASGVTIVQMINSESADLNVEMVEAAVFAASGRPCIRN